MSDVQCGCPESEGPGESRAGGVRPVIGLTASHDVIRSGVWHQSAAFVFDSYVDGVVAAGGIPVMLAPLPEEDGVVDTVLDRIDGLVLTGGPDVNPNQYGQEPHQEVEPATPERDSWETALLAAAIARDVPFLGVCRGAQVLNVALGGTLHQHLPDVVAEGNYRPGGGTFGTVGVHCEPGSRVRTILDSGDGMRPVWVYHHQAIDRVAELLRVTARSEHGVVQAVELDSVGFGVGVQWHPEQETEDRRLFAELVRWAAERARARACVRASCRE